MKKIFVLFLCCIFVVNLNLFATETFLKVYANNKYGKEVEESFANLEELYSKLDKTDISKIATLEMADIDKLIKALDAFIIENPETELLGRVNFMLGECYYIKAINLSFNDNNKDKDMYNEVIENAILAYQAAKKSKHLSDFFIQNLEYRLAEAYFAKGNLKRSFDISSKFSYNYLSSDIFYLLGLTYINFLDGNNLADSTWTNVDEILKSIKTVKGVEQKLAIILGITSFAMEEYEDAIKYFKKFSNQDTKYFLGKSYENLNQFIFAIGEYRYILKNYPKSKYTQKALVSIGDCLYKSYDYKFAIETYNKYLNAYKYSEYKLYVFYKTALCYFKLKQYSKAVEYFDMVFTDEKSKHDIKELRIYSIYVKAYCYYMMKNYEEAAKIFLECSSNFVEEYEGVKSVFMAGICYYNLKKYHKAEQILQGKVQRLIVEDRLYVHMYYLLGKCQYANGKLDEAAKTYQYIVNNVKDKKFYDIRDQAFFMLNLIVYKQKNYKRIVTEFQHILYKINPAIGKKESRMKSYFIIADSCYRMRYFEEAKTLFTKISQAYVTDDIIYSKAIDGLAWCEFKEKNYKRAERYRIIIADVIKNSQQDLSNLNYSNYYELGNIYFNNKKYMKAIENYEHCLTLENNELRSDVLYRLGDCYYREEYYSIAIEKWQQMLKAHPKDKKALDVAYKIADTYYKSGIYDKAVTAYRFIIKHFDKDLPIVVESALRIPQSYFNAKDYDNAILEFKKFVVRYPETDKIQEAIDLIESTIYRKQEYAAYLAGKETVEINIAVEMDNLLSDFIDEHIDLLIINDIIYKIAKNYFDEGNYEKSLSWFYKFFKLGNYSSYDNKKIALSQYCFAESYYSLKKYPEAIKEYNNLINNFSEDFDELDKVYIKLGTAYLNIKEYQGAVKAYKKLLEKFPNTEYKSLAFYNLGISYKELNNVEEANKAFIQYYKLNPQDETSIQIMLEVGDLYIKKRDYLHAIAVFSDIIPVLQGAQKIYAQYKIGEAYEKQFKYDMSILEYKKLLKMGPAQDEIRLSGLIKLAEILQEEKKYYEAYDIYNEVIANTDNEDWKSALGARMFELESIIEEQQQQ